MSRRIKLALVSETTVGGIRKHILAIAAHIDRKHFDITVITPESRKGHSQETGMHDELNKLEISHKVIPMVREISPLQDFKATQNLERIFRQDQFDLVHAHGSKGGFLARYVCKRLGISCCYSPHVFAFQRASHGKAFLYRAAERIAASWTRFFIVLSEQEKYFSKSFGIPEDRIYVVTNALPPLANIEESSRTRIRKELNARPDHIAFLTASRLVRYKGHELLLTAFSKVVRNYPTARLWIAGEGEEADALQKVSTELGLTDSVRLLGFRKDIENLLLACDCFLLTSQVEGSSYSILEALALEKPVIATAVPGIQEVFSDLNCVRLVPWKDEEALAGAIMAFLKAPLASCLRDNLPAEWFDVRYQMSKLEDIYQRAVISREPV